ncbi:PIG-L deacetylase family protein [Cohnella silvisoli]|uniref:PIG-L deacetylase family protein n=1 Tax=Cohnella silvisoli TaxID=2873699 RepID=A0ABV1KQX7_9BACL|nr:PIG-L deacetylase family protein [Cohnella silvisoli]MCD9022320.1 PIG-L family deacetylase [Cohnella silvisoli]
MTRNKVLVIAAHPDDEILGCGATMAKHKHDGDEVSVVILAEGLTSRDEYRDRSTRSKDLSELGAAAYKANEILGVDSVTLEEFADNRMDSVDRLEIIKKVEFLLDKYRPDVVYTHHIGDVNIDHRRIHEAVLTACRPIPGNHRVNHLLYFEVPSSTEWMTPGSAPHFAPNWFVDVSDTLELKLKALEAYHTEMREWPHTRSIKAVDHLARWRGATISRDAAEAFVLGRTML